MLDQKRFLFRFRFPCRRVDTPWSVKGCRLDESFRLPTLRSLEEGNASEKDFYDLRVAWHETGLALSLRVDGKKHRPWCHSLHPEESDGLQICLDTRDIKDVHRATRFCHRLIFLPTLNEGGRPSPKNFWLPIHRAKAHPNPIDLDRIKMFTQITEKGYQLDIFLEGKLLTGFEPSEYSALGFHYVVNDRERGNRYFLAEPPLPHDQDPSLWGTLELLR